MTVPKDKLLVLALDRFREHQRLLAAADRAERYLSAAVRQLALEGSAESNAIFAKHSQQILDEFNRERRASQKADHV